MKTDEYQTIMNSVADGVFTVDLRWRITSWNRAAERITGFSKEEALGRHCYDVFRANLCQTGCILRRTLETGKELINMEVTIVTKAGEEKPISISTALLKDLEGGKTIGGVETFRDLSAIENLRKRLSGRYSFQDIIGKSHPMQEIFRILPDIAESESTALIQGPTGSGKELFAKAIHNLSPRKSGPFVTVNCAALPDTLLESELFGYRKGAFTDATRDKPGRFALAEGGTLFLDEIGDISAALQAKILRVLQEKAYEPLGGTQSVKADVRIIAATNRDLREEMALGRFRDDLYYRLNIILINIPPLAERKEDIPLLVDHFISYFNAEKGKEIKGMNQEAMEAMMHYDFPGNIRELENIIERAFILCKKDVIDLASLPPELKSLSRNYQETRPSSNPLKTAEAEAIRCALAEHGGHREKTAKALGIHKTTLLRKMKRLGIS
ncbi:MAG: sigma 54-interacting transcriptional regulator [Nitrospinae bacterium]|nr:sigma 54-interacting transcriptional regulator [Nitrospinota bacterium]